MEFKAVKPFEPLTAESLPTGERWAAQVKWDGVRMLTYSSGGSSRLINRKGNERTLQYPEFTDTSLYCKAQSFILDGEMMSIENNKPSFHAIMKRDSLRKTDEIRFAADRIAVNYMIFDLLYCNGEWVTDRPLEERQQLLEQVIVPNERVQLCQNYPDAEQLFEVMRRHNWEGVVCKDLDSTYAVGGKDKRWQKKKFFRDLYAAIGGVTYRDGIVNALLLGLYDEEGRFLYIGHAGAGKFTVTDWRFMTEEAERLKVPDRPFHNMPARVKGAAWMLPSLTVRVEYLEWTSGWTLRHPVLQGFAGVSAEQCTVDQI
ncbi:DNA ligase [Paenibacillus physcomitrellae]|uniref:DNA ligase (ATP) n=1 Tax=Paenibacillus physcomitrellae TaxID=1619311 RepID=A0ABQ1FTA9_9BACL|nr:DNA ligase [Paenibacillus physcomitrellae]GGA27550.1 DNA ligase [Paenibacillus physcomitrellae]